jgi:hypothetical protein
MSAVTRQPIHGFVGSAEGAGRVLAGEVIAEGLICALRHAVTNERGEFLGTVVLFV